MTKKRATAQVHRFRDWIAVSLGTGETVYLSPAECGKISRAMNKAARSVKSEPFHKSQGLTVTVQLEGQ